MNTPSEHFDFDKECLVEKTQKNKTTAVNEDMTAYSPAPLVPRGSGHDRYNYGIEYQILPFNNLLQMRGNDNKHIAKHYSNDAVIYIGDYVSGWSPKDRETHNGTVQALTYRSGGVGLRYVWIIDEDTHERIPLTYKSTEIERSSHTQNTVNSKFRIFKQMIGESYSPIREKDGYVLSSGVRTIPEFDELVEDDEMYRQWMIENIRFNEEYVKYFDMKFYTEYFTDNKMYATTLCGEYFTGCIGLNYEYVQKKTAQKFFKYFYTAYAKLTDQYDYDHIDLQFSIGTSYIQRSYYQDNPLQAKSWHDLYCMVQALNKCYRYVESLREDRISYQPTTREATDKDKWVNENIFCDARIALIRRFLCNMLIPQPEQVRTGDWKNGQRTFKKETFVNSDYASPKTIKPTSTY